MPADDEETLTTTDDEPTDDPVESPDEPPPTAQPVELPVRVPAQPPTQPVRANGGDTRIPPAQPPVTSTVPPDTDHLTRFLERRHAASQRRYGLMDDDALDVTPFFGATVAPSLPQGASPMPADESFEDEELDLEVVADDDEVAPEPAAEPLVERTFDSFFGALPDPDKDLITGHITSLKNALDTERKERKALDRQLKEALKKTNVTEWETKYAQAQAQATTLQQNADFFVAAVREGVRADSLRLALTAAREHGALTSEGMDWDALREAAPVLFMTNADEEKKPPVRGNAGSGTRAPTKTWDMNQIIRNAN